MLLLPGQPSFMSNQARLDTLQRAIEYVDDRVHKAAWSSRAPIVPKLCRTHDPDALVTKMWLLVMVEANLCQMRSGTSDAQQRTSDNSNINSSCCSDSVHARLACCSNLLGDN